MTVLSDAPPERTSTPSTGATSAPRRATVIAISAVLLAGLVFFFWTRSDLWLDEALSVNVARLPVSQIPSWLRHDGAPPLYYVLLHYWMGAFGTSTRAVRALAGVCSVLTLPVGWRLGRAVVTMKVDKDVKLPDDSTAAIRWRNITQILWAPSAHKI